MDIFDDVEDRLYEQAREAIAYLESVARTRDLTPHEQRKYALALRVLEN